MSSWSGPTCPKQRKQDNDLPSCSAARQRSGLTAVMHVEFVAWFNNAMKIIDLIYPDIRIDQVFIFTRAYREKADYE